jgi:hypothetical protein
MVKVISKLSALFLFACAAAPYGCSSETKLRAGDPDASTPAESGAPDSGGLSCGGASCEPPPGIGIERITQCCTDSGGCGLQFPGAIKCLEADQVGNAASACGSYTVPDVPNLRLDGCCGPQGCGKLDAFLGCIVNTDLGLPAATCTYDPTNDCSPPIADIPCDGSEDCPTGQRCCSAIGGGGPSQTGCYDSCVALDTGNMNAAWRELCHTSDQCEDPTFECRTSQNLPSWLFRCVTGLGQPAATNLDTSAGRVNCGTNLVCANGQKCCAGVSASTGPTLYCAEPNEGCLCHGPGDGGAP